MRSSDLLDTEATEGLQQTLPGMSRKSNGKRSSLEHSPGTAGLHGSAMALVQWGPGPGRWIVRCKSGGWRTEGMGVPGSPCPWEYLRQKTAWLGWVFPAMTTTEPASLAFLWSWGRPHTASGQNMDSGLYSSLQDREHHKKIICGGWGGWWDISCYFWLSKPHGIPGLNMGRQHTRQMLSLQPQEKVIRHLLTLLAQ